MAVAYLHAHKICHFDIKGNNLLLTEQGEIRVTDFGLAKKFVEIGNVNTDLQAYKSEGFGFVELRRCQYGCARHAPLDGSGIVSIPARARTWPTL